MLLHNHMLAMYMHTAVLYPFVLSFMVIYKPVYFY